MNNRFEQWSKKCKEILLERLKHDEADIRFDPVFSASNIHYDFSERISAISCGGIGLVHTFVKTIGLDKLINRTLFLLKIHKPYQESDHVMNMTYNVFCGGKCIEDIELLRNDAAYLDALGADRIPDPTTAGDFIRRFGYDDIDTLQKVNNHFNRKIWSQNPENKNGIGIIDVDGIIVKTHGEKKERMDMSYKGIWGFSALIITESNSGAHLFVVNRSGNAVSHDGSAPWIDRSIKLVQENFNKVYLRGDSDFGLTFKFDEWDKAGVKFCFASDSIENLREEAENLPENSWEVRPYPERKIKTRPRRRKANIKKQAIKRRGYRNQERIKEHVAEFIYQPKKCKKSYRVIVVRRIIKVTKGQLRLADEVRYFFYITNIDDMTPHEIVDFYNKRCNHENKLEQLSNGVHALKMPAKEFNANWAYMVICMLAWNLKSWLGQMMPNREMGEQVQRMEFKRFMNCMINIPCQILKTGRRVVYRILGWRPWIDVFWETFHYIKGMRFAFG